MAKVIDIKGRIFIVEDYEASKNSGGRLDKMWVREQSTGLTYLVKTSTAFGLEPFSEVLAYRLGLALGFNVVEYMLIPASYFKDIFKLTFACKYVSLCPNLETETQKLITLNDVWKDYNIGSPGLYSREQVLEMVIPKSEIDKMLFFDALIGNRDRHAKNIHILLNSINNQIIGFPLLDNGDSFMSQELLGTVGVLGDYLGKASNKSATVAKTHDKQMQYITTLDTSMYSIAERTTVALQSIEPILDKMGKGSKQAISNYLRYRIYKYYSMFGAQE